MCRQVYSVFRWKPDRSNVQRRTEICPSCSKIKNLCQTCIRDLQFALPSQLRDAVLSVADSIAVPENDANKLYKDNQVLDLINGGDNPWMAADNPNEKLLKIARTTAMNRPNNKKLKLPTYAPAPSASASVSREENNLAAKKSSSMSVGAIPLPPGISSVEALHRASSDLPGQFKPVFAEASSAGSKKRKLGGPPPPPAGPPPPDAFKNKREV